MVTGPPVAVGLDPNGIVISPDGTTACIPSWLSGTLTPISTAGNHPGRPIGVGGFPYAMAITP